MCSVRPTKLGAIVDGLDEDARRERLWISATFFFTPWVTSRLLAPMSIIVMPVTASPCPSRVMTPNRIAAPTRTVADVADQHRRPVFVGAHDDVGDLVLVGEPPHAAQGERLAPALDVAAADVHVGARERVGHVAERHLVRVKTRGIDDDLVLLQVAAHRVDLDDAGHLAELGRDLPVEERA